MHASSFHDRILHGEDLFHSGYVQEALQVFEAVLAEDPEHMLALNNCGVILHRLGRYPEAEQMFTDLLRHDAANANAVVNLGSMYIEQYNIRQAEALLGQYGQCLSPQDITALKTQLQQVARDMQACNTSTKTQVLRIAMDVHGTPHTFAAYLNDQEPTHRALGACCASQTLYQPGLSTFLAEVVRATDCLVDIGAHIGYFTLLGATLVGSAGQVWAFEPEEKNYRYLQDNIVLNQFAQVYALPIAVGLESKTAKMFINADNDAGHALWNVGRHPAAIQSRLHCVTRDVRLEALDTLLQGVDIPTIKLINIDTGGAELDVIQGAVGTLVDKKVPYVICSINRFGLQQMGTSEQELRQFMGYLGYTPYWLRAVVPHLVALTPAQQVESSTDFHLLFAKTAWVEADTMAPLL